MIEGSDYVTCTFVKQIGPEEDNHTIAQTLSAHVTYQ